MSPGARSYFEGGFVTYSNELKMSVLGVREETLKSHGAVSEECVREMAAGAMERAGADVAIATSGVAGPGGGTPEHPVGTVCIATGGEGRFAPRASYQFRGNREWIKTADRRRWRSIGCGDMRWGCRSAVKRRFSGDRGRRGDLQTS